MAKHKKGRKHKKKAHRKHKGNFYSRIPAHTVCRNPRGRFASKTSCRVR